MRVASQATGWRPRGIDEGRRGCVAGRNWRLLFGDHVGRRNIKTWGDGRVQRSNEQAALIIGGFRDRVRALEAARRRTFPVSGQRRSPEILAGRRVRGQIFLRLDNTHFCFLEQSGFGANWED